MRNFWVDTYLTNIINRSFNVLSQRFQLQGFLNPPKLSFFLRLAKNKTEMLFHHPGW